VLCLLLYYSLPPKGYPVKYSSKISLALLCLIQIVSLKAAVVGNGSTLSKDFLQQICQNYNIIHPTPGFKYLGTSGSGAGITNLIARNIAFAGSDVPPTSQQIDDGHAAGCDLLNIPIAVAGVSFGYNLPGYTLPLKLTAKNIADILTGKILTWDDPAFFALNPHLAPEVGRLAIKVVIRSDSSGSTGNINQFLSSALGSTVWPFSGTQAPTPIPPGFGNPNTVGRKGSTAVAQYINNNAGAFGYVGFDVIKKRSFPQVKSSSIQNKSGAFIAPTVQTIQNALNAVGCVPTNLRISTINSPASGAYPIASPTNIVICLCQQSKNLASELQSFLTYVINEGQSLAAPNFLAPINKNQRILQQARVIINRTRNCAQ